jgi:hypothetical protein
VDQRSQAFPGGQQGPQVLPVSRTLADEPHGRALPPVVHLLNGVGERGRRLVDPGMLRQMTLRHQKPVIWKQRYEGMKAWRPFGPGLNEAEIPLGMPLPSAQNARSSASQRFASGQAHSDQAKANQRGHF